FQAEDGIRDFHVTGVQTCALPISPAVESSLASSICLMSCSRRSLAATSSSTSLRRRLLLANSGSEKALGCDKKSVSSCFSVIRRSEERRVGKECRSRRSQ